MSIENRPTLYAMLKAEGCELSSYQTDLYVVDTPAAREVIAFFEKLGGKSNKQRFRSEAGDNKIWFDLPFHYSPKRIADVRPSTYADGRDAQLSDIDEVSSDLWVGTARDGREIAFAIDGTRIVVSAAPAGQGRLAAMKGLKGEAGDCEVYFIEAEGLLDRGAGRTLERISDLAGLTRAPIEEHRPAFGI